jgi:hypothetical protein
LDLTQPFPVEWNDQVGQREITPYGPERHAHLTDAILQGIPERPAHHLVTVMTIVRRWTHNQLGAE